MLNRLSLKAKLFMSYAFLSLVLMVMGGTGFYGLSKMKLSGETIADETLPNVIALGEMRAYANAVQGTIFRLSNPSLTSARREKLLKYLETKITGYSESDKKYTSQDFLEGEEALYNDVKPHWQKALTIIEEVMPLARSMNPEDHQKMLNVLLEKFDYPSGKLITGIVNLTEFQKKQAAIAREHVMSSASEAISALTIVMAIGLISAFLIGFIISQNLSKALTAVSQTLSQSSNEVRHISGDLADASNKLSQGATEQAAALQETASSLDEVQAMVAKNSDNAGLSSEKADVSLKTVEKSYQDVQRVISAIEEIKASNQAIAKEVNDSQVEMSNLVSIINEIGTKTKVINDIVFQTKLLSFNASVEAARAGEHGKGFAVVAEEVGNLAAMSGQSAKEIGDMLTASITKVEGSVEQTKSKVERIVSDAEFKVENGVKLIHELEQSLQEIREQAQVVHSLNSEISRASQEQSQGVSEINKAINQLDSVTQENANAALQCSSSADTLTVNVDQLASAVNALNQVIRGRDSQGNSPDLHVVESASRVAKNHSTKAASTSKSKDLAKKAGSHNAKKSTDSKSKVVPMPVKKHEDTLIVAKASGDSTGIPQSNDPRFEDI